MKLGLVMSGIAILMVVVFDFYLHYKEYKALKQIKGDIEENSPEKMRHNFSIESLNDEEPDLNLKDQQGNWNEKPSLKDNRDEQMSL